MQSYIHTHARVHAARAEKGSVGHACPPPRRDSSLSPASLLRGLLELQSDRGEHWHVAHVDLRDARAVRALLLLRRRHALVCHRRRRRWQRASEHERTGAAALARRARALLAHDLQALVEAARATHERVAVDREQLVAGAHAPGSLERAALALGPALPRAYDGERAVPRERHAERASRRNFDVDEPRVIDVLV